MDATKAGCSRLTPAWVVIEADEYRAIVSTQSILGGRNAASHLANLVELEAADRADGISIRLDCCAEVGREVVACLRQTSSYIPPTDVRLLRALQQQLDYIGIWVPAVPAASVWEDQEVILVPSYFCLGVNHNQTVDGVEPGMLMYSSSTHGWANLTGRQDPRWVVNFGCIAVVC